MRKAFLANSNGPTMMYTNFRKGRLRVEKPATIMKNTGYLISTYVYSFYYPLVKISLF